MSRFTFVDNGSVDQKKQGDGYTLYAVNANHKIRCGQKGEVAVFAESLNGLYNLLDENFPNKAAEGSSDDRGRDGFHRLKSYAEAMDIFKNRPETVREFAPNDEFVKLSDSAGINVEYDMFGDYIDISKFLEGVPEVYGRFNMGNPIGLFASIYINMNQSCMVDEKTINERASRVVRIVDWLESQNIRCEIRCLSQTMCHLAEIVVKRQEDTVDLNSVAVVAHSDFMRRLLFRLTEHSPTFRYGYGTAYGFKDFFTEHDIPQQMRHMRLDVDWFRSTESVTEAMDNAEKSIATFLEEGGHEFYHYAGPSSGRHF